MKGCCRSLRETPRRCSNRPSSKTAAEESTGDVASGYVADAFEARTTLVGFFSSLLRDDVADQIIERRVGDLNFDDVPCRGRAVIDVDDPVDLRSQPFMAPLQQQLRLF